jgi:hypothetical protein
VQGARAVQRCQVQRGAERRGGAEAPRRAEAGQCSRGGEGGGGGCHSPKRRRATTRRARAPARRPPAASPAGCATPQAHAACMGQRAVASTLEAASSSTSRQRLSALVARPLPNGSRAARPALLGAQEPSSRDSGHAALQLRVLLHLVARGTRQPVAIRRHSHGSRIGPGAAGRRVERRVEAAAARLWRRRRRRRRWRRRRRRRWLRPGPRAVGVKRDRHLDQEYAPFQHARRDDRFEARALGRRELDLHAGPHARRHLDADSLHAWRWRSRGLRRRFLAARAARARRARARPRATKKNHHGWRPNFTTTSPRTNSPSGARLQNMLGPTHIGEVARGAGTPRSGGAAERRLDGIAYVASREQFL